MGTKQFKQAMAGLLRKKTLNELTDELKQKWACTIEKMHVNSESR